MAAGVTLWVHIEIDSGLHRVGLAPDDRERIADFARLIRSLPGIELEGSPPTAASTASGSRR